MTEPSPLVLASASPRRRELLTLLGVEFEAVATGVPEVREGAGPKEIVLNNARAKALAGRDLTDRDRTVLGVDTEVVLNDIAFGKPSTAAEAANYLARLSGRSHEVLSALVMLGPGEAPERTAVERTAVSFRELETRDIELYVASGEWRDRAGGYAIQGLGSMLVEKVDGDLANVIGMPLNAFAQLAPEFLPKL